MVVQNYRQATERGTKMKRDRKTIEGEKVSVLKTLKEYIIRYTQINKGQKMSGNYEAFPRLYRRHDGITIKV